MKRPEILELLAQKILALSKPHPVRVGIDGVDASGKTVFANDLAELLQPGKKPVIRASIDGFHHPKEIRLQRGEFSPEGYYLDSFDYKAFKENFLIPLGPDGNLLYRERMFDFRSNASVEYPLRKAAPDAIALCEGVFLFRPEIFSFWDFKIFIEADFRVTLARASLRDQHLFGDEKITQKKYMERYIPGQKIYLKEVNPAAKADVVIDNNDFENPKIKNAPATN